MSGKGRERKFQPTHVGVSDIRSHPHIRGMNLELDDEQAAALIKELSDITENSRYPFSPRYLYPARDPVQAATRTRPRATTPTQTLRTRRELLEPQKQLLKQSLAQPVLPVLPTLPF
jgi:hypothetical protein